MRGVAGALAVGFLLLGLPTSAGWAQPSAGEMRRSIDEVLERRSRAILERDRTAFLSTIDRRDEGFVRDQITLFDSIREIPLVSYRLTADWSAYGDLARPSDRQRYGDAEEIAIPLTTLRYRIRAYDDKPVIQDLYFTFVRRGEGWLIAADDDLDDLGFFSAREPWDSGPVVVTETEDFFGVAGRCSGCPQLGGTLTAAAQALGVVNRQWGPRWDRKVPIYAPRGSEELGRIIQATYPLDNYVAFAFWTGGEGQDPGARIIVNPARFAGGDTELAVSVLTHELFHVASLPHSGPFVPNAIEEGYAQYVQYEGSSAVISAADASATGRLPADYVFFLSDPDAVLQAYRTSLSAVGFIAERWGAKALERFYVRLGRAGHDPGTASFHLDRAMRRTLGVGVEKFHRLWASSIAT